MSSPISATSSSVPWNFRQLVLALFVGLMLQSFFLPCLCAIGTAKITLVYCFDGLVLLRMLIAHRLHEKGSGWVFYVVLCYTSPAWVEGLTYLVLGKS